MFAAFLSCSSISVSQRPTITSLFPRSDADSDVLADYVMALVRADDAEPQLRQGVISNLEDFLKESR